MTDAHPVRRKSDGDLFKLHLLLHLPFAKPDRQGVEHMGSLQSV